MKKLSFFLMAMLVSLTSFAAALGEGYEKVTDVSTLAAGDKVVLYCDDSSIGVIGVNGTKDAAVAATGWVEYLVEAATGGVKLKDTNANKYVSLTTKNTFTYAASGSVCKVNAKGVLGITLSGTDYFLYNNGGSYYRMYTDKTGNASYKPFYVYKILAAGEVKAPVINGEVEFETSTTVTIEVSEGLKAYYTLDGTEPTTASTEYTAPFEVTETTTVTAVAYDEAADKLSEVSAATFKKLQVLTCAEAAALCTSTASADKYIIKGYVTSIAAAYDASYNNVSFWMADTENGGNVIQAFRVYPTTETDKAVKVGDYVVVGGKLKLYNSTPEIENGTFTITEAPAPEPVMFTVTATAENGTVEGAGEYEEGKEATLTATAAEGYEFVNWTADGAEVSTENPYTFVVTANVALVANFKAVVIEEPLPEGVPTNAELWEAFKPYYNQYYLANGKLTTERADQPIENVTTFAANYMMDIMTDAASEYKWLGDYIAKVTTDAGRTIDTEVLWRFGVAAFFNCKAEATSTWNGNADFTEAGKPQAWGPYYLAAQTPVEPEPTTETVYFINAKKWAKVNVYAWTTDPNASWPGAAATKEAEQIAGYDVYSFTANAGQYANVIFNDGSSQTPDLVWTAGKYYVIDMGWLTKEEAETKLAAPLPETWNIVGAAGLMGTDWNLNDAKNAMTLQADGTYLLEKKGITLTAGTYEYKAAKDHGWTVAIPQDGNQKLTISTSGIYDVTFVLNVTAKKLTATATLKQAAVVIPTIVIAGDMNSWNQTKDKFTMSADSLTATFKTTLAVKNYGFKMIVGGAWHSDGKTVTRAANSTKFTGANSNTNSTLKADIAGEYLFTWEYATKTLTVTYPALPVKYNVTVTAENGTVTGAGEYEEGKTATLTATAAEGYEFVNWTVGEEVVSTENPYSFVVTADVALVANFKEVEPEIEWLEMPLEITNLTTEVMEVEGAKYLLLQGRDDMNDADVMLFLNNYADVDDDYEVNAESSYMTFGGLELTVLEGVMTQTSETDKGTIYNGIVRTYVAEDSLYVAFNLTMYAAPATVLELTDAIVAINEDLGTLTFNVPTGEGEGYFVELSGYTAPGVHEGPQICLFETPEVVAFANYVETSVADGVITLKGEFVSPMGPKFDLTISGKLPVVEEPEVEKPEPTYTENNLNPYAFGLESKLSDDKTTLTVTYRLNNSNATSVNVLVYNGEDIVASIPGTTTIGKNTVEVATGNLPAGVELKWAVEVNGTSVEAPTAETKIYSFYHPSGVDIDINPENPTFGMLLVNEGMQSVASKTEGYVSAQFGAGIFAFTPSFDLIPNGELPGYNGGIEFTTTRADGTGTAYSPRRIRISEDGRIFVTSLNTDGNYLWEVNADNLNEWTPVFKGTLNDQRELITEDSAFIAAPNNGFDVKGSGENLQLAMYSVNLSGITAAAMSGFRLHEYNLGTATEWTTAPSKTWVEGLYAINYTGTQVEYDNEGGLWIASYRGTANDANPGLVHINADGVEDAKLVWNNVRQAGIRFNKDFTKLVVAGNNGAAKKATIYTISKDANGAPVLTEEAVIDMAVVGNNLNDFAWDYAGNLYSCGNSAEKLAAWAMPYSGQVETPAAAKYAFQLPEPLKLAGTVKRAVQNGDEVIVLTHEADGTAHIYQVVDGKAIAEVSQEGVIARDPENAGDLLAISDIAVTEDGKLVAINYMHTQAGDSYVNEGQKRGETRVYLWNDLAGDPSVLFTSKMSSNWFRSKQGLTMAVKGTSDNMEIFTTGIHATSAWARVSSYRVIDGVYVEPEVNHNDHYFFYDINDAIALETTVGTQYELNASPLGEMNWVLDAELINPTEIVEPETNNIEITTSVALTEDLGKKYNGASYVTVGEKVLMVAPFANPDGQLVGAEILNITNGFDAPVYVDMVYVDEAVAATAAATAVEVVEGGLNITLVADAAIHTWFVEMSEGPVYEVYEDEITNLVIDLDNLVLIGGPSANFQVDVFLGLGEYNRNDDTYQLLPESSIAVMGSDATFIDGYAYEVDAFTPSAKAVVHCEWNGMLLEFHLTMTAEPMEATKVVVENATVEIEKYVIFGDVYDYALKMSGEWINPEDGLTYPVLVEVPVYYPEATEPSEIMSTVTVGGWGDNDPWLGFGEGTLTVTTVDNVVTATGIVQNPMAGVAIDITISGNLTTVGLENTTVTAKPVKMIKNGQLVIEKDGVQYNAQGATVK